MVLNCSHFHNALEACFCGNYCKFWLTWPLTRVVTRGPSALRSPSEISNVFLIHDTVHVFLGQPLQLEKGQANSGHPPSHDLENVHKEMSWNWDRINAPSSFTITIPHINNWSLHRCRIIRNNSKYNISFIVVPSIQDFL